jgi:hypothetical protein
MHKEWVSTYQVSVRADQGKTWEKIGNFVGNTDCLTEVVNKIENVFVRYIRIIPQKYYGSKSMRICVFGPGSKSDTKKSTSETVSYTVTYPSKAKYMLKLDRYYEKTYNYYKGYCRDKNRYKKHKRNELKKSCKKI